MAQKNSKFYTMNDRSIHMLRSTHHMHHMPRKHTVITILKKLNKLQRKLNYIAHCAALPNIS